MKYVRYPRQAYRERSLKTALKVAAGRHKRAAHIEHPFAYFQVLGNEPLRVFVFDVVDLESEAGAAADACKHSRNQNSVKTVVYEFSNLVSLLYFAFWWWRHSGDDAPLDTYKSHRDSNNDKSIS